jgi:poly(ADP-ribose) glycohydrolase ARH3
MINAGESWEKASEKVFPGGSFGNGAAMRIAPIGLLYYDDPKTLKDISFESSHITHANILGKEGAALVARAIAWLIAMTSTFPLNRNQFLTMLYEFAAQRVYRQRIQRIEALLGKAKKAKVIDELGNGSEAPNSVPAAIFSFLSYPDSYEDAVVYAVSLGADTDTIGAMTGAISGSYLGVEAIPREWISKLENRIYLESLAETLWRTKIDKTS